MKVDPSFIGTVQDVMGTTVTVALSNETITGISLLMASATALAKLVVL